MGRCRFDEGCDCQPRIRMYLAGTHDACDELIENLMPLIWAIVRRILKSARIEDHRDAVQEVLLKVFHSLDTWRGECPFCNWVEHVAATRAIDLVDKARRRKPAVPLPPGDIPDPRPQYSSLDLRDCREHVLAKVPPEWRKAFELTYDEDKSRKEVAQILDQAVRTIDYWLAKMKDRMRRCLKGL